MFPRDNVLVSALRGGTRDVATPARSRWSITNSASTTALTYWYGAQSADDAIAQPPTGRPNRHARRQRRPRRTRRHRGAQQRVGAAHAYAGHARGQEATAIRTALSSSALRGHSGRRHGAQRRPAGSGVADGGGLQREERWATTSQQLEGSAYVTDNHSPDRWTKWGWSPLKISHGSSCRLHEQQASVVSVGTDRSSHKASCRPRGRHGSGVLTKPMQETRLMAEDLIDD